MFGSVQEVQEVLSTSCTRSTGTTLCKGSASPANVYITPPIGDNNIIVELAKCLGQHSITGVAAIFDNFSCI